MKSIVLLLTAIAIFGPNEARAEWQSGVGNDGRSASAVIASDRGVLTFGCAAFSNDLSLVLTGGPFPGLRNKDGEETVVVEIALPSGQRERIVVNGYFYDPDKAFVGGITASAPLLDAFAGGTRIELSSSRETFIAAFTMKGTSRAREDFRRGCGL